MRCIKYINVNGKKVSDIKKNHYTFMTIIL